MAYVVSSKMNARKNILRSNFVYDYMLCLLLLLLLLLLLKEVGNARLGESD